MGRLFLITGDDEFLIKDKARELISSLCGSDPEENPSLEIIRGDSDEVKPLSAISTLISALNTPSLLTPQKTVFLKNIDFAKLAKLAESERDSKKIDGLMEILTEAFKMGLPGDVTVVISAFNVDRRSSFFKTCQKFGEIHSFEKLDTRSREFSANMRDLILDVCEKNGKKISVDALSFITEACGSESGRIQSELEKVFAYIHPRNSITLKDCRLVCAYSPEAAGWAFSNALSRRNLGEAIEALNMLINLNAKNPEISILYSVIGYFQNIIRIKAAAEKISIIGKLEYKQFTNRLQNVSPDVKLQMQDSIIFTTNPYRAWNIFMDSHNFTNEELVSALSEILKANRALVSGSLNPRINLEELAMNICAG